MWLRHVCLTDGMMTANLSCLIELIQCLILLKFIVKKRRNWHRHDYTEPDDGSKPVQAGTRTFVKQLRARSFPRYRAFLAWLGGKTHWKAIWVCLRASDWHFSASHSEGWGWLPPSSEVFPAHPCFRWIHLPFHALASPVHFCTGVGCLLRLLQGGLRGFEFWCGFFFF